MIATASMIAPQASVITHNSRAGMRVPPKVREDHSDARAKASFHMALRLAGKTQIEAGAILCADQSTISRATTPVRMRKMVERMVRQGVDPMPMIADLVAAALEVEAAGLGDAELDAGLRECHQRETAANGRCNDMQTAELLGMDVDEDAEDEALLEQATHTIRLYARRQEKRLRRKWKGGER